MRDGEDETQKENKMAAVTMSVERNRENKNRESVKSRERSIHLSRRYVSLDTHHGSTDVGLRKSEDAFQK
jgi:hypothetical protein